MLPAYIDLLAARVADAIDHETDAAAAACQPLGRGTLEVLQADLADARAHGDVERLAALWRDLPGLALELQCFEQERGSVLA